MAAGPRERPSTTDDLRLKAPDHRAGGVGGLDSSHKEPGVVDVPGRRACGRRRATTEQSLQVQGPAPAQPVEPPVARRTGQLEMRHEWIRESHC